MSIDLGQDITTDDIIDQIGFFDDWEDKYAFIIDLGKQLPSFPDADKNDESVVKGCQSLVWISHSQNANKFVFQADSDAIIVKGLLAIILAAYNHKTALEIRDFDIDSYFSQLDLLSHITNVRGNGIQAMVSRIREIVA